MKTKQEKAEYMRNYRKERYANKRNALITRMGGKCVACGCSDYSVLEMDHIKPNDVRFRLTTGFYQSKKLQEEELIKCQLLCKECHIKKSILERGNNIAKGAHGTISSYRYCKCELCKKAASEHAHAYKVRTGRAKERVPYEHGTRRMYVSKKCRCDECKKANTNYTRILLSKNKQ